MADLWAAAAFAVFLTLTLLFAGDRGHDGIRPGQRDDSDTSRRLR
ncbi:MAG TPA: hypothetical protein VE465_13875 [Streptosporangiaceae bacterium]|jgi:hypothetical protein|nr:hypothetical protein [Streptosporangiaceae bacterium]